MHSLFGNSATAMSYNSVASLHSKGKGKGKTQMSATMSVQQSEQDFLASVRDALPEAAKLRSQTTLLQSEWDVEVVSSPTAWTIGWCSGGSQNLFA